ncbi:MAG: hypothetical protein ACKV22_31380 [Bryobacteraceae bacterium]
MKKAFARYSIAFGLILCIPANLMAAEPTPLQPLVPQVEQVYPQGWTAGESAQVTLWGNFLDHAQSLVFDSDDVSGSILESSFTRTNIMIRTAANAKLGLRSLRLLSPRGTSNRFHFRVTGWRSVLEQEPNDDTEQAQSISQETSINGVVLDTNDSDFYRLHAKKGEVIAFSVLLGRNGYATGGEIGNVTLTLLDASGRRIDSNFSHFIWDPYFQHTFNSDGDYFIVVDHARLAVTCFVNECENRRLGETYQLVIGRAPAPWSLWPPAGGRGASLEATLTADFIDRTTPLVLSGRGVTGSIISERSSGVYRVAIKVDPLAALGLHLLTLPERSGTGIPLAFTVYENEPRTESEPNDTLEKSNPIAVPTVLVGRVDQPGDVDSFLFQANEGERLTFQIEARRIGSEMLDPHLALLAADGDIVALNDDAKSFSNPRNRDSKLDIQIPYAPNCAKRSDRFFVQVRDNSRHAGDSSFYVLTVRKQKPDFSLGLTSDRVFIARGGTLAVPVALRRAEGFVEQVTVEAEGLPAGVTAKRLLIKATEESGKLELSASPEAATGIYALRVSGSATIAGQTVTRPAEVLYSVLGDGLGYVRTDSEGLRLSVVSPVSFALERMGAEFRSDRVKLPLSGGREADVIVKIRRRPGFEKPLQWFLEGLPRGVMLFKTELTDEQRVARLVLRAVEVAEVPVGEYRVAVVGSGIEATPAFLLRIEP